MSQILTIPIKFDPYLTFSLSKNENLSWSELNYDSSEPITLNYNKSEPKLSNMAHIKTLLHKYFQPIDLYISNNNWYLINKDTHDMLNDNHIMTIYLLPPYQISQRNGNIKFFKSGHIIQTIDLSNLNEWTLIACPLNVSFEIDSSHRIHFFKFCVLIDSTYLNINHPKFKNTDMIPIEKLDSDMIDKYESELENLEDQMAELKNQISKIKNNLDNLNHRRPLANTYAPIEQFKDYRCQHFLIILDRYYESTKPESLISEDRHLYNELCRLYKYVKLIEIDDIHYYLPYDDNDLSSKLYLGVDKYDHFGVIYQTPIHRDIMTREIVLPGELIRTYTENCGCGDSKYALLKVSALMVYIG